MNRIFRALVVMCVWASAAFGQARVGIRGNGREVMLGNGLVTVTIVPANAEITSIKYLNHEMVCPAGAHKFIYFSRDGGEGYENVLHCQGRVAMQTDDTIDYACRHAYDPADEDKHAWDVEVHFALRAGVSGVYVYAITSHPASYPELQVGEWRMV